MPKPEKGQVHANVTVFARGLLREVFTRIYLHPATTSPRSTFPPACRRRAGPRSPASAPARRYDWDVRLQGEGETVFFEIRPLHQHPMTAEDAKATDACYEQAAATSAIAERPAGRALSNRSSAACEPVLCATSLRSKRCGLRMTSRCTNGS